MPLSPQETIRQHVALYHHLAYNHYPPVSSDFIPTAEDAINAASVGKWEYVLHLPNGLDKTVREVIDELHLHDFLRWNDEAYELDREEEIDE